MSRTSLDAAAVRDHLVRLSAVDERVAHRYPGASGARQPVHTCYVPADSVDAGVLRRWSEGALSALDEHAAGPRDLAEVLGLDRALAEVVHPRVRAKLAGSAVEDLRIDFEDGYGHRDDDSEDAPPKGDNHPL